MSEVTQEDLNGLETRIGGRITSAVEGAVELLVHEMSNRFGEVNQRLDRMDATLKAHGKLIESGTRAIAGFTGWIDKADADYTRVLAELTDLKIRMAKLEARP